MEDKPEDAGTCSVCGQIREEQELIHLPRSTYCVYCRRILEEWATQIGDDHGTLIERLDVILQDMLAVKKEQEKGTADGVLPES